MSDPLSHYWGPVTSTLDWCEANYQFSPMVAEMANTFSNLITISIGLYGTFRAWNQRLPQRYWTGFSGVAFVGIGSLAFHATLLYEAQLADELPMVLSASYCCFVLFDTRPGFDLRSARGLYPLILFNMTFIWSYAVYRNPVFHQVVFASLMLLTIIRTVYLLRMSGPSKDIPVQVRSIIVKIYWTGTGIFLLGFFVWNLDNIFCDTLTTWKFAVGWPIAFLLEGHSWWHCFTALGAYLMMLGTTYLTLCVKDTYKNYTVTYPYGFPQITRIGTTKSR